MPYRVLIKVVLVDADRLPVAVVYPKMNPKTLSMFEAFLEFPTNGTLIVVKLVMPWNAPTPILVIPVFKVKLVTFVMFMKAATSTLLASVIVIVVKLLGIV